MACPHLQFLIFSLLILFISPSKSQTTTSPKPKSILLPVTKDPSTLQYLTTHFNLGTPLQPKPLVLDLGGRNLWIDCDSGYNSSTYRPGSCGSATCSAARPLFSECGICFSDKPRPGCNKNTCSLSVENTITRTVGFFEVSSDTISIQSTIVPKFIFACASTWLTKGLSNGSKGMAGLGRTHIGLPRQLSTKFGRNLRPKFSLCLPSSSESNGFVLFGDAPSYVFHATSHRSTLIDVSEEFTFTKLYVNPVPTADDVGNEPSADYFVGVTSIMINRKSIPVNKTLLSIDQKGYGGTKFSTINRYTVLESSIYNVVAEAFGKELKAMNVAKVAAVAPFSECFSTKFLPYTMVGPDVPDIGFVFENKGVFWELYGSSLVKEVSRDVVCLAFLDGGLNPRTSIVIGAHQLEENLLQFDLAASRLGITSTLIRLDVECAGFRYQ